MATARGLLVTILLLLGVQGFAQEPVATIGGENILDSDLPVSPEELNLRQQMYEVRIKALEGLIANKLLEQEAERREMTVRDLITAEVGSKVGEPTNREVTEFYNERKDQIGKPLKEVRESIVTSLQRAKAQLHLQDLVAQIEASTEVEVFINPPRLEVTLDAVRLRGPEEAPVTIVEFSDFQCPYCRRVQPTLAALADQYGDEVRWGFKDLPLTDIHPEAMRAAQVARCADDQGKFWDYRSKLFDKELFTDATYREIANELKLKPDALLGCADSSKHQSAVVQDMQEARSLGISGTPAILINGILVTGAREIEVYQQVIDRELKLVARANP